jgi:amidase
MFRAWSWPAIAVWAGCALPIFANYTDTSLALGSVFPLQQNAGTTELFPMPLCNGFKLEEATIDQMQQALNQSQVNSQQLVTCYLRRIHQTEQYIKYDILRFLAYSQAY